MTSHVYEDHYKEKRHFSFGQNWQNFLKKFTPERLEEAKKSLQQFLEQKNLKGKSFVDIGCGSGLFSLAAVELGAEHVVSVDVDDFSVECAHYLKEQYAPHAKWNIKKGSALDKAFMASLGHFDVVYSWGVLHHTGDMARALDHVSYLVKPSGLLFLAIYNKFTRKDGLIPILLVGSSDFWLRVKRLYNTGGILTQKILVVLYYLYYGVSSICMLKNPFNVSKTSRRGMSFHTNVLDWLGGYPYEYATIDELIRYFSERGLYCLHTESAKTLACHQILFKRF